MKRLPALMMIYVLVAFASLSQVKAQTYSVDPAEDCYMKEGEAVDPVREFEANLQVKKIVFQITRLHEVREDDFDVKAANVPNATAKISDRRAKILYNPHWLYQFEGELDARFFKELVLAHEIGHHFGNHTLGRSADRKEQEKAADRFAGKVLCRLGATVEEARSVMEWLAPQYEGLYPSRSERIEAITEGWTNGFRENPCPQSDDRNIPAILHQEDDLEITPQNVNQFNQVDKIIADRLLLRSGVELRPEGRLMILANQLSMEGNAGIYGPNVSVIASRVEGGLLDISGDPGESAGQLLVAADRVVGTVLRARGGRGEPGETGPPGRAGNHGRRGRDGKCGFGFTGDFRGSTAGSDGQNGQNGQNGLAGGAGGNGGEIYLLTHHSSTRLAHDTAGGEGGEGGPGGQGGSGGEGGQGGSGCIGGGGHQPDRPDGRRGRDGQDGIKGPNGPPGLTGQIWTLRLTHIDDLKGYLMTTDDTFKVAQELREKIRTQGGVLR